MYPNYSTKIINLLDYLYPNKEKDMKFDELDMCYLAGMFDGDGSFSLIKKVENEKRSPLYFPLIQLGASGDDLMQLLKEKFGGYIHLSKPHASKEGVVRNNFFRFKLEKGIRCKPFLECIIPYLKLKQERAQILLDYINAHPFVRGSRKISQDVLYDREKVWAKMLQLNSESHVRHAKLSKSKSTYSNENEFWSYIAGLMDSDGSFSINKNGYWPHLQLSMIDIRGINYLNQYFPGGCVQVIRAKTCKTGMIYRWMSKKTSVCESFLNSIIPFLRVKKGSAKCLLEFIQKRETTKYCRQGISEENMKFREHYHKMLKCINKYGVYKPSLIDLEAQKQGDRAEGESHRERLNEMDSKECAIV